MTEILYFRPEGLPDLARATSGASGFDLTADLSGQPDGVVGINPHRWKKIPLGLYLAMPLGIEAQIRGRSGLASRGIIGHLGTIDSDYRGECCALLFNHDGGDVFRVSHGDRVCQLIFAPVLLPGDGRRPPVWLQHSHAKPERNHQFHNGVKLRRVPSLYDLPDSERGAGGWGSTGVK